MRQHTGNLIRENGSLGTVELLLAVSSFVKKHYVILFFAYILSFIA